MSVLSGPRYRSTVASTRCPHPDQPARARVCAHLIGAEVPHVLRFTGRELEHVLVCEACADVAEPDLVDVCEACREAAADAGWDGIRGAPEVREAPSPLRFVQHRHRLDLPGPVVDLQPVVGPDRNVWIALLAGGALLRIDLDTGRTAPVASLDELPPDPILRLAPDGRLGAVAARRGTVGRVVDLASGATILRLARDGYHAEHCEFPLAFVVWRDRTLVIHAPGWNRLDVVDPRTGEVLTERGEVAWQRGEPRPAHYLDYFHCGLTVSPDGRSVADNGWVWGPRGIVTTWRLDAWLERNPWESEDGPTRRAPCWRDYAWDRPLCWLDGDRIAVWGFGEDDLWLLPAARVFRAGTGEETHWFPGPRGALWFDRVLVSADPDGGAAAWDVEGGARLVHDPDVRAVRHHPTARAFVTLPDADGTVVVSRLVGHDAEAAWNTGAVADVARAIAREGRYDGLPVLGDALEAAGCDDEALLAHCRRPGPHAGRCWALDRLART